MTFTQKSKCGGNRIASRFKFQPSKGVSLFQEGVSLGLLERKKSGDKKKGERYKKIYIKEKNKKIKREKEKERKEEGKSGREPATFT